ncbi:MAG: thiamine diphosphokinase [Acidimicrobiia bacterium]|nr:thiamine diphosphokinase [Acidimicrobiia bacterium]MDH3463173.1 thiamine diphosphokinase [Acidimicrobiia bacterium]
MSTVLVFAGGDPVSPSLIDELPTPDYVIAADSGFVNARALGYKPDVVVGDFDSLPDQYDTVDAQRVRHPAAKDHTDLELAFELALHQSPHRIVLVGAEGGRLDHELAAVAVVCSRRWDSVPEVDWVRRQAICSVVRQYRRLQGDLGGMVSLLAVGGDAEGVTTEGLQWALADETLPFGSSRGVSNRIVRPEFTIRVRRGTILAIVFNESAPA